VEAVIDMPICQVEFCLDDVVEQIRKLPPSLRHPIIKGLADGRVHLPLNFFLCEDIPTDGTGGADVIVRRLRLKDGIDFSALADRAMESKDNAHGLFS
jgi:hypothetical protein